MQNRIPVSLFVLAALCGPTSLWAQTKVGVVNVASVSEKYSKTKELEGQFDALRKSLGQQRDTMKEKIERAKTGLQEELKPGTDEYLNRRKEIAMMEAELQWFVESEGQKVERGLAQALRSIYDDIQICVQEIASEQGFQIVLAADTVPDEAPDTPSQARQTILLQKVLYWKPEVDLTEAVLARLNQRHKPGSVSTTSAGKPSTPPAKPAAKPADTKKP